MNLADMGVPQKWLDKSRQNGNIPTETILGNSCKMTHILHLRSKELFTILVCLIFSSEHLFDLPAKRQMNFFEFPVQNIVQIFKFQLETVLCS